MGNFCDCLGPSDKESQTTPKYSANERTPLVSGHQPATHSSTLGPTSARTNKPPRKQRCDSPENLVGDVEPLQPYNCKISTVDKRFRDHAKLYNDILEKRDSLKEAVSSIKSTVFPDVPKVTIKDCFAEIKRQCGDAPITLIRKFKYCMQLEYDPKDYPQKDDAISSFQCFNVANKLVKEILDKLPSVLSSIELVINDEQAMRRDIMAASLGADGAQCLKNCVDTVTKFRKVPEILEKIRKETELYFDHLKNGVSPLVTE